MNYTDSDIQAIVNTQTEQLKKEIQLKDEEYNILKVTSEQIEEEQRREIYELNQRINKAKEFVDKQLSNKELITYEDFKNSLYARLDGDE